MEKLKVLIVEDDMISAAALRSELKAMGHEVCPLAPTGEKAIRIAETEHPDLAFMDVRLRGEMNGIDASREISSRVGASIIPQRSPYAIACNPFLSTTVSNLNAGPPGFLTPRSQSETRFFDTFR